MVLRLRSAYFGAIIKLASVVLASSTSLANKMPGDRGDLKANKAVSIW